MRKYTMVAVFRNSHILQRDSKIRRCKEYASAKIRPIDGVGVYDFEFNIVEHYIVCRDFHIASVGISIAVVACYRDIFEGHSLRRE